MNATEDCWTVLDKGADLRCGPLSAHVSLDDPTVGITNLKWSQNGLSGLRLFRFSSESKLGDVHIRGQDLIATYVPVDPRQAASQVYWRACHHDLQRAVGIELVISMQTDLLDCSPHCVVFSKLPCKEVLCAGSFETSAFRSIPFPGRTSVSPESEPLQLFVVRLLHQPLSFAQLIHPADFTGTEADRATDSNDVRLRSPLFLSEHLEKGVIRRARMQGWLMPLKNDLETAVKLARAFVEEPLPLTA